MINSINNSNSVAPILVENHDSIPFVSPAKIVVPPTVSDKNDVFNYASQSHQNAELSTETEDKINYVVSHRAKDIMNVITAAFNMIRSTAIEQTRLRALTNISLLHMAAQDTRNQANEMMKGAIAAFVMSGVSSAVSLAGSLKSLSASNAAQKDITKLNNGNERLNEIKKQFKDGGVDAITKQSLMDERKAIRAARSCLDNSAKAQSHVAQNMQVVAQSILGLGQSTAQFANTIGNSLAKECEADGQVHQAHAQAEQQSKESYQKLNDQLKQVFDSFLQAARDIRDTQDQVKANIARNA